MTAPTARFKTRPPSCATSFARRSKVPDARTILIANQEVYDQILKQGETANLEQEHGPGAPPVASLARAESLNTRDRRLPVDARRVLIVMFAAIAALWTIWAVLIQIGR